MDQSPQRSRRQLISFVLDGQQYAPPPAAVERVLPMLTLSPFLQAPPFTLWARALLVYEGLVKRYAPAFTPERHDALLAQDYLMAVWQGSRLVPAPRPRLGR